MILDVNCSSCGKLIAHKDNDDNIYLSSDVISEVVRHSYYIALNCPYCDADNTIKGFIDLESFNNSTLNS